MKTVVKTLETNQVLLDNVHHNKYYGFILAGNSPGMIIRDGNFKEHEYIGVFFMDMTRGNVWCKSSTLTGCIRYLLSHDNKSNPPKVFEFDSYQELFKWASDPLKK